MISTPILAVLALAMLCTFQLTAAADMEKYYKRTGAKYLKSKSEEASVITLASGMLVEVLKEGTKSNAKSPNAGGRVG
jgi:hypothetical protein